MFSIQTTTYLKEELTSTRGQGPMSPQGLQESVCYHIDPSEVTALREKPPDVYPLSHREPLPGDKQVSLGHLDMDSLRPRPEGMLIAEHALSHH